MRLNQCLITAILAAFTLTLSSSAEEERKLSARHVTVAKFESIDYSVCTKYTGLCPDRCGASGEYARFSVEGYIRFINPDPSCTEEDSYSVQLSDYDRKTVGDAELIASIRGLRPGDLVLLWWDHERVTEGQSSFGEQAVRGLSKMATNVDSWDSKCDPIKLHTDMMFSDGSIDDASASTLSGLRELHNVITGAPRDAADFTFRIRTRDTFERGYFNGVSISHTITRMSESGEKTLADGSVTVPRSKVEPHCDAIMAALFALVELDRWKNGAYNAPQ